MAIAAGAVAAGALVARDASSASGVALEVPPWRLGDEVTYETASHSLTFRVVGPRATILADGRIATALAVDESWRNSEERVDSVQHVLPAEGVLAARLAPCGVRFNGECTLAVAIWDFSGGPAVLGASVVAGRTLALGDAWRLHECDACLRPFDVSVHEPRPESAEGTVLTVAFTDGGRRDDWQYPRGEMDLGRDHPYPLEVRLGTVTYRLVAISRGETPAPPLPTAYPLRPPLASQPYQGARPAEGPPFADLPSWAAARANTSDDPTPLPRLTHCSSWLYDALISYSRQGLTGKEHYTHEYDLRETCRGEDGAWWQIGYERRQPNAHSPLEPFTPPTWRRTVEPTSPPPWGECAERSIPHWDLVRHLMALKLVAELEEYHVQSPGGTCSARTFSILGPPATANSAGAVSWGTATDVTVRYDTGRLLMAFFARESWPSLLG